MEVIGIICEYNPFHNGHRYHIDRIKEMFPDSILILALNGYFLERGEISYLTKEDKVKIALENRVDLVAEIPFVFGSQSADTFADAGVKILHYLGCTKIVFGSESSEIEKLKIIAERQLEVGFDKEVKTYLDEGINYPTALKKAISINVNSPNDLLGISYIKAILKNNFAMEPIVIQRTSGYHDLLSNDDIISASNIREKYKNNIDISKYTNYGDRFVTINHQLFFNLIKHRAITSHDLNKYLTVNEGIENKIVKEVVDCDNIDELVVRVKSKRYTFNRINRMFIHIIIGFLKTDRANLDVEYVKILGFNKRGQNYLSSLESEIPIERKISDKYIAQKYELTASKMYDLLTNSNTIKYELSNKPIYKNID